MNSARSNILDNMNKSYKKSALNRAASNEKSPVIKPLVPKPKSKQVPVQLPTSAISSTRSICLTLVLFTALGMGLEGLIVYN